MTIIKEKIFLLVLKFIVNKNIEILKNIIVFYYE